MPSQWLSVREQQTALLRDSAIIANRMEAYAALGRKRKIEYRAPLLDRDLVDLHLSLPPHLKRQGSVGRYIFRRALQRDLIPEICWRPDKAGSVVPGAFARFGRDRERVATTVSSIPSESQLWKYVDRGGLRQKLASAEPHFIGNWLRGLVLAYQWHRVYNSERE